MNMFGVPKYTVNRYVLHVGMARWPPPLTRLWHPLWQRGHASYSIWTWLVQLVCAQRVGNGMSLWSWSTILAILGSFLADKGETFGFVLDLILRLKNERNEDVVRAIRSDNGSEFKNSHFETFCRDLVRTSIFFSLCGLLEWCSWEEKSFPLWDGSDEKKEDTIGSVTTINSAMSSTLMG
jgi:hypothetical protein